ncbi:MAG: antibiotic biosynthesis monooxygenase family protein [Thermomicrobiales bacterium]
MMTVMSETRVKAGHEAEWDAAYAERAADARTQDGWVDLHLLVPETDPAARVIVGTWRDKDAWRRWHQTETFQRTRELLDGASDDRGDDHWYAVVEQETA